MNFFEAQDQARRHTGRLVVLFSLAVLALLLLTNLLVMAVIGGFSAYSGAAPTATLSAIDPLLFLYVSLAVVTVVVLGTLYKMGQLKGGGRVVAEWLGGKLISPDSRDSDRRRVLNVVEEMAIASGTPVPPVYLMDKEAGINAFAAGFQPGDAVIGITRGTMRQLNRDQLQGVIAHEFSHILNGDMRLNIRIMGVIHGIMVIGYLGQAVLRGSFYSSLGSRRRSSSGAPGLAIGLGLMLIGVGGTLFGNLIKAAVSRQREFLADASAVQFTRNPAGIGGALKRIGGLAEGSLLASPRAAETSHAFFGNGIKGFGSLLATHPPLEERIRRIEPGWDGLLDTRPAKALYGDDEQSARKIDDRETRIGTAIAATVGGMAAVARTGRPSAENLQAARQILAQVPVPVMDACHDPYSARAVIYALIMAPHIDMPEILAACQARLDDYADTGVADMNRKLLPLIAQLGPEMRLPLVDLCLPALTQLSPEQHQRFKGNLAALMAADAKHSLFEWTLNKVVTRHLDEAAHPHTQEGDLPIHRAKRECEILLSILAYADGDEGEPAEADFAAGLTYLQLPGVALLPREACHLGLVEQALDTLVNLQPLHKRRLLKAALACIHADGDVTTREAELLRAIADSLGCPMPAGGVSRPD